MATKKAGSRKNDELRSEYEVSELRNPTRGKYYARAMTGTNVILLDADVAEVFRDAKAVNDALRALVTVARAKVGSRRKTRRQPA